LITAHNKAHRVQVSRAAEKFISHVLDKYPAGIIATSLGKGKKLDSRTIITNIPV
jgi:hypothetical protein